MDPISALNVAAATVQFIDFVGGLMVNAVTIYRSEHGSESSLMSIVKSLVQLNDDLTESLQLSTGGSLSTRDTEILRLCQQCSETANTLISLLNKLRNESKNDLWSSFLQALRTKWSDDKIKSLKETLDSLKSQISMYILTALRYECPTTES